jgi:hypothetical protein
MIIGAEPEEQPVDEKTTTEQPVKEQSVTLEQPIVYDEDVCFTTQCVGLNLFESASFVASAIDPSGNLLTQKFYTLSGEAYRQWGNDDNHIVNISALVLTGAIKIVEPEKPVDA